MVILDTIASLQPAAAAALASMSAAPAEIRLDSGAIVYLDSAPAHAAVWLTVLRERHLDRAPVYLEVDEPTFQITRLLLPDTFRVENVLEHPETIEVEFECSHARHFLPRVHPDFARLLGILRAAQSVQNFVLVTEESDRPTIIDVRDAPGEPLPKAPATPPESGLQGLGGITLQHAGELFDTVGLQTCVPLDPSCTCIPFLYPDDGCWGRAHQMARLIEATGAAVQKIWHYGKLRVETQNNPNCEVTWRYHVAPTVLVLQHEKSSTYVLDPSLFPGPVPADEWTGVQGDANAVSVASEARVFYRGPNGHTILYDDDYVQTAIVLKTYRLKLLLRSAGPFGPPPYDFCPIQPA